MRFRRTYLLGALLVVAACAPPTPKAAPEVEAPSPAPPMAPQEEPAPAKPPGPGLSETSKSPEPDPEVRAEAARRYTLGRQMFQQGRYDQAEVELKEALNLYPFMAAANLTLGKVFLIRGAAAQDQVLIDSARLMFKMAHSIDPELREASVLLSLFEGDESPLKEKASPSQ